MDIEKLYERLNENSSPEVCRQELINSLKNLTLNIPDDRQKRAELAYEIAGLLSTKYAKSLSDNDNLDAILTMAGELEIDADYNKESWEEFINLIQML